LLLGGKPGTFIKNQALLGVGLLALSGLGNGCDELGQPPFLNDFLGRLSLLVEFPMPDWIVIGRVEDGVFEEGFSMQAKVSNGQRNSPFSQIYFSSLSYEKIEFYKNTLFYFKISLRR